MSCKEVDKYYHKFTTLSSNLVPARMLTNDVSLCFYRGIPTNLRKKIKKRIPAANLKTSSPPTVTTLLELLQVEFNDEDLDAKVDSSNLNLDSDSDSTLPQVIQMRILIMLRSPRKRRSPPRRRQLLRKQFLQHQSLDL